MIRGEMFSVVVDARQGAGQAGEVDMLQLGTGRRDMATNPVVPVATDLQQRCCLGADLHFHVQAEELGLPRAKLKILPCPDDLLTEGEDPLPDLGFNPLLAEYLPGGECDELVAVPFLRRERCRELLPTLPYLAVGRKGFLVLLVIVRFGGELAGAIAGGIRTLGGSG